MISISYKGIDGFLEVQSLWDFVQSYKGGKGDVRSMEGMLQEIAQACANVLHVDVTLKSELCIKPSQTMKVTCYAFPDVELFANSVSLTPEPPPLPTIIHSQPKLKSFLEKVAGWFFSK